MDVPLRSASDLARLLGIDRQRLNPYVGRAGVAPVARSGSRLLYDGAGQRAILAEYHDAQHRDTMVVRELEAAMRLYRLAHELGLLEDWLARPTYRPLCRIEAVRALVAPVPASALSRGP